MRFDDTVNEKSLNFYKDGNFYIYGNFDDSISTDVIPYLVKEIEEKKKLKSPSIKFYINSYGGYTMYLKDMLDLIEHAKSEGITIETYVSACAYSCGSMLAVSGSKGHRYVGRYAEHLVHLGASGAYVRNDVELERQTHQAKSHFDFVREIYKKNCKIKNLDKVIHDDSLYIRGKDLIDFQMADKFMY